MAEFIEQVIPIDKDLINHAPHHRADSPYETTRVIEEWNLGWHLGNVLKYIARHELKGDELGDLKKAQWYLNRRIALMETLNGSIEERGQVEQGIPQDT
jgi:hypothetical protein